MYNWFSVASFFLSKGLNVPSDEKEFKLFVESLNDYEKESYQLFINEMVLLFKKDKKQNEQNYR